MEWACHRAFSGSATIARRGCRGRGNLLAGQDDAELGMPLSFQLRRLGIAGGEGDVYRSGIGKDHGFAFGSFELSFEILKLFENGGGARVVCWDCLCELRGRSRGKTT